MVLQNIGPLLRRIGVPARRLATLGAYRTSYAPRVRSFIWLGQYRAMTTPPPQVTTRCERALLKRSSLCNASFQRLVNGNVSHII